MGAVAEGFSALLNRAALFYDWRNDGLLRRINSHLVAAARDLEGRQASPSAGVIDSQSIKTTERGRPRGFDAGKKVKWD